MRSRRRAPVQTILATLAILAGCRPESTTGATPVAPASSAEYARPTPTCPGYVDDFDHDPVLVHLERMKTAELYVRRGSDLVIAPADDLALVRGYPTSRVRGPLTNGRRITLLAKKQRYAKDEEIRVIHVLEVTNKGEDLWVMGPKPVVGEYLDDKLVTPPVPQSGAFTTMNYDGRVSKSPGFDVNFEIATYRIKESGAHIIQWKAGSIVSNRLCVEIE